MSKCGMKSTRRMFGGLKGLSTAELQSELHWMQQCNLTVAERIRKNRIEQELTSRGIGIITGSLVFGSSKGGPPAGGE